MEDETLVETGTVNIGQLTLESGVVLDQVHLAYEWARRKDAPVVLVCHALTGNQFTIGNEQQEGWWHELIGPKRFIDTERYSVLSFNVLGGCHGSTGAASHNSATGQLYRASFPEITIRDMVKAEYMALRMLGIEKVQTIIGGSLGGMRTLEWGIMYPQFMAQLIPIAVTPSLSAYGIAFNCIGLHAIEQDEGYAAGQYKKATDVKGFETARMAGMVTYRSDQLFNGRFARKTAEGGRFEVESYLQHVGKKIGTEFDPSSYCTLLRALNTHDVTRARGNLQKTAERIQARTLFLGFSHDLIYPPETIRSFSHLVENASFCYVHTAYGHDGFLAEYDKWGPIVEQFMEVAACRRFKQQSLASVQ